MRTSSTDDWATGNPLPLRFADEDVAGAVERTLVLVP
jgi:hypothetical protein